MTKPKISLNDKYSLDETRILLTGTQALVRLTLIQHQRDKEAGLNTAGYVSGYRGSPLGGMDKEFTNARTVLNKHKIKFHPAINEDLAATAIWGTQQLNLFPDSKYEGIFSMWYGKGPGVDRSGDAFRHANLAGTAPKGGVLVLAGDDPACKSSTIPSQSEHALMDVHIPILNPINIQEILDFGIYGWGMSRYSGCWVGMKCITDNIDTSASIVADSNRIKIITPQNFQMPTKGLHIRWPDPAIDQEYRLQDYKLKAALAFARSNKLDQTTFDSPKARFGIIATGKSYLDTLQALYDLGIDKTKAAEIGIRLYKVEMPWPLEKEGVSKFAKDLEVILIIEEKRPVMESQIKEFLFHWNENYRPKIIGKKDENGKPLFSSAGELNPTIITYIIAERIKNFYKSEAIDNRLSFLRQKDKTLNDLIKNNQRLPYFCSGCPHNTSTKVPDGSRAIAGIGCHFMVTWMNRSTSTYTHMGAEGASWIGQSPFTNEKHVFVNMGDGTYLHSGIMAIRASVAAGVNITYKILYNDAVAMTGGQSMDGPLDVPMISRQVSAEGVARIVVVSDDPNKYNPKETFANDVTIYDRDHLDTIQRELRNEIGVSVLIYDQTCAAEKRRRRKRGTFPISSDQIFINQAVCEGCGDCGIESNCVSITPIETELGRKREINQSACNKDFSCLNGFCPSFVTVSNTEPKLSSPITDMPFEIIPKPKELNCDEPYNIIITGIGGTGVITIAAIMAMAAHIEDKGVTVLDMAGMAQKNGEVFSHLRIAKKSEKLHAVRISEGAADLLLGCDLVTAASKETLGKLHANRTKVFVNSHENMTADFTADPDLKFQKNEMYDALTRSSSTKNTELIDTTRFAIKLLGDEIAANMLLVGYAYQKGALPILGKSIEQAIILNGVSIELNKRAFEWGRRIAFDPKAIESFFNKKQIVDPDFFVERRANDLKLYQNEGYAARYTRLVEEVRSIELERTPGQNNLSVTVAKSAYKLMAYKDEYEVARLFSDGHFIDTINNTFQNSKNLTFHLAPPIFSKKDPRTGYPKKIEFGPWIMKFFKILTKFKSLRGTFFDIFGYTQERKTERRLIEEYEVTITLILKNLSKENYDLATEIASVPLKIRGFGHIKQRSIDKAQNTFQKLMSAYKKTNHSSENKAA